MLSPRIASDAAYDRVMWRSVPLVLILLFAPVAQALFQLRDGWTKFYLTGRAAIDLNSLISGTHAEVIWRYSDQTLLVYAPAAELPVIQQHVASSTVPIDFQIYDGDLLFTQKTI